MNRTDPVYVAGHRGLVGSAIVRVLEERGFNNLILRSRAELDLTDQRAVQAFFAASRPRYVFLTAARVGGILANSTYPADFIRDNLAIQLNVIETARQADVAKLLFLGSSCIYPRLAPQPMQEQHLLTGKLEPTNEWYAIAKIAGVKMCQAYRRQYDFNAISLMPTNLYGPRDNFSLEDSHVIPALLRKFHDAKVTNSPTVSVWGTGAPRREFLYSEDLADAALFLMQHYDSAEIIYVGAGEDIAISALAEQIATVVGFTGELQWDHSKPDGPPRKLLDSSRLAELGWRPSVSLTQGLTRTYAWYLEHASATAASNGRAMKAEP